MVIFTIMNIAGENVKQYQMLKNGHSYVKINRILTIGKKYPLLLSTQSK